MSIRAASRGPKVDDCEPPLAMNSARYAATDREHHGIVSEQNIFRLCIGQPKPAEVSETFLRAHQERLPCHVTMIYQEDAQDFWRLHKRNLLVRAQRKARRIFGIQARRSTATEMYYQVMRRARVDALLAEYGFTGVIAMDACAALNVPLIVHFHGFDISRRDILAEFSSAYQVMFRQAAAVIGVSKAMCQRLIELGAPAERVHYLPYGVDCDQFAEVDCSLAPPHFVAVGRFVDKKAPHLTLMAFREVVQQCPEARLVMIGAGPLLPACVDLARAWGIDTAVEFMAAQPHEVIREKLAAARCFVQHSVEAADGNCEGTPNSILEAGATGLPVVSTRHAGIPDVVMENQTGLLVDEHDVAGMAQHMVSIAKDANLAGRLGSAARERIVETFEMNRNMDRLWSIIESCAS